MKKVFIVHGYNASSHDHWFPWLKQQVESTGSLCDIVQLENAQNPQYAVWKQNLIQQIQTLNDDVIIVTHSLGGISSLGFLSEVLNGRKIHALYLISGFNRKLPALPELNEFIDQIHVDDETLRLAIKHRFIFFSNNDPFVPAPFCIQLGHLMNAQMKEVKNAGHFMATDGYTAFPELWEKLAVLLISENKKNERSSV